MKVAICSLNSQYIHSSLAPWCLFSGIKAYADANLIQATVIEGTINEQETVLLQRILEVKPDVVSFCTYIWNVSLVLKLTKDIKNFLPQIKIVLGGPEVSYCAEHVFIENPEIDFILSGEGEYPFAKLMTELATNTPSLNSVPGLCYRMANNEFYIQEPFIATGDPVSPYSPEYLSTLNGRIAYLETSRGCPYSCAFCLSGRCGGVRFFDIQKSKENMILLANSGATTIKLIDRTFNADKKRAYELFSFIIEEYGKRIPKGVCFHFEIAGDILDDSLLNLLETAPKGSIQMEIGLQSFNEKTLESVVRKTNTKRLVHNILALLKPRNIHVHIDLIVGLPYEDFESFKNSFNLAYSLYPDMLQFGFLKLLYGAPMRENKETYPCEFTKEPPYEVTKTPWLSEKDIELLTDTESVFDKLYNSGRFHRTIEFLVHVLQTTPFDIFFMFSQYLKKIHDLKQSMPLDEYTNQLFFYFSSFDQVDKSALRDVMVCDRFSTNSSNILPSSLKIQDPNLKKLKTFLATYPKTKLTKNQKRSVAILYSQKQVIYVDYHRPDVVTGQYPIHRIPFSDF